MQVNLLLKAQKAELREELAHLEIKLKMAKELNHNFTKEVRGFVQRSELDFRQLYEIQDKQIIHVDYNREVAYRAKAFDFVGEAFSTQRAMTVNTLRGLRSKMAILALKVIWLT